MNSLPPTLRYRFLSVRLQVFTCVVLCMKSTQRSLYSVHVMWCVLRCVEELAEARQQVAQGQAEVDNMRVKLAEALEAVDEPRTPVLVSTGEYSWLLLLIYHC